MKIARSVIPIQDVRMAIADVHGNVIASRDGEACFVMNVSFVWSLSLIWSVKSLSFIALNYCEENPNTCENGGKCTSLIKDDGNFKCECPSGYRGEKCEILPPMMTTSTTTTTVEPVTVSALDAAEEAEDDTDNEA